MTRDPRLTPEEERLERIRADVNQRIEKGRKAQRAFRKSVARQARRSLGVFPPTRRPLCSS